MLLDYVAANEIHLDEVAELVEGAAEVCRRAGVALVGGETAELPGIYAEGELDFAGTAVGVVTREPAEEIAKVAGDRDAGLIIMGLHSSPLLGPRMGSVTYRVLCLAHRPVLALPPQALAEARIDSEQAVAGEV